MTTVEHRDRPAVDTRSRRLPPFLRADSGALVVAGLALVAAGLVVIAFCWGRVAGMTDVQAQLPWAVGGGSLGIALAVVGLATVGVQVRRRTAAAEERTLGVLAELVHDATEAIAGVVPGPVSLNGSTPSPARRRRPMAEPDR